MPCKQLCFNQAGNSTFIQFQFCLTSTLFVSKEGSMTWDENSDHSMVFYHEHFDAVLKDWASVGLSQYNSSASKFDSFKTD